LSVVADGFVLNTHFSHFKRLQIQDEAQIMIPGI